MNIHISNLALEVTEDDLRKAFETFGEVSSITFSKGKHSSKSKGSADITMPDPSQARRAIHALRDKNLKGRPIKIKHAKLHGDGRKRGGSRRSAGDKEGGTRGGGRF